MINIYIIMIHIWYWLWYIIMIYLWYIYIYTIYIYILYILYIHIYIYTYNSGFFTEKISAFLGYHLKALSQKVKSFIKDTNNFLKKLNELRDLPDDFILCTIDAVFFLIHHNIHIYKLY